MKIIIVRDTYISSEPVFAGDRVQTDEGTCKLLIQLGHAVPATKENEAAIPEKKSKAEGGESAPAITKEVTSKKGK